MSLTQRLWDILYSKRETVRHNTKDVRPLIVSTLWTLTGKFVLQWCCSIDMFHHWDNTQVWDTDCWTVDSLSSSSSSQPSSCRDVFLETLDEDCCSDGWVQCSKLEMNESMLWILGKLSEMLDVRSDRRVEVERDGSVPEMIMLHHWLLSSPTRQFLINRTFQTHH